MRWFAHEPHRRTRNLKLLRRSLSSSKVLLPDRPFTSRRCRPDDEARSRCSSNESSRAADDRICCRGAARSCTTARAAGRPAISRCRRRPSPRLRSPSLPTASTSPRHTATTPSRSARRPGPPSARPAARPARAPFKGEHRAHPLVPDAQVFRCATWRVECVLTGHERTPWTVKFHPHNNRLLASGSLDQSVRIWDVTSRQCLCAHARPPKSRPLLGHGASELTGPAHAPRPPLQRLRTRPPARPHERPAVHAFAPRRPAAL